MDRLTRMPIVYEILFLSASGESLIRKKYRPLPKWGDHSVDVFFQYLRDTDIPIKTPYFYRAGRRFFNIKRQSVYIVATTVATKEEIEKADEEDTNDDLSKADTDPLIIIEYLSQIYQLCKDFCGTVTEESVHANMFLIMEILDEVIDYGYAQNLTVEKIKPYIQSEPVVLKSPENMMPGLFGIEHRVAPSDASNKPVIRSRWDKEQRKNEIFLDVIERMSVQIAANGTLLRREVNGEINMKCFLMGNPDIKLGLNEDLTVGKKQNNKGYGGMVNLDTISFHQCVNTSEFNDVKILSIRPPEGEFQVLTYSVSGDTTHGIPFRVFSNVKETGSQRDLGLGLNLRCEIPASSHAVNVKVIVPVPSSTSSISQRLSGPEQSLEFLASEKKFIWTIKKLFGKTEVTANLTLIDGKEKASSQNEIGPIALDFEISGFVCSNLQVRFLRVFDREHSYVPFRWVRYITTSDSYVFKLNS